MSNLELATAAEYLRGESFVRKVVGINLPSDRKREILNEYATSSNEELGQKADRIIEEAKAELLKFCGDAGDIVIPFSGGRDSSIVAILASQLFPDRNIILMTAQTGYSVEGENPAKHAQFLKKTFDMENVEHRSLDLAPLYAEVLVPQAVLDRNQLGYPALCTVCKMGMEMAIHHDIKTKYSDDDMPHVLWGYINAQGEQNWPEQTHAFRDSMDQNLTRFDLNSTVHHGAPLANLFRNPGDSTLILARLGLSLDNHKLEADCLAAGTNPVEINAPELADFVLERGERINQGLQVLGESAEVSPSLAEPIIALVTDETFMEGAYEE